jgi:hypothetical protein
MTAAEARGLTARAKTVASLADVFKRIREAANFGNASATYDGPRLSSAQIEVLVSKEYGYTVSNNAHKDDSGDYINNNFTISWG